MQSNGIAPVEAQGLGKYYGSRRAVDGISLTIRPGEVYGLLGPNGAGKTTTLRMVLGLARPSTGRARVFGHPPGSPAALARLGMLVEGPGFYPYLSGRANLRVLARYCGVRAARVEEVLATVGLAERAGDPFGRYSLGMKQRLGVGAALLKEPDLLVLDEPTNGLDPAGVAEMRGLIRRLGSSGSTVLLSSHLLAEVEQVCDRIGVVAGGRLVFEGTVGQLRGERRLVVVPTPLDAGRAAAEALVGAGHVEADGSSLRLDTDVDAARLNRHLHEAGIDVHELRWAERSLEDVFLELTSAQLNTHPATQPQEA
jgi:ABC-2 type transport system ATP-binding protein